MVGQHRDRPRCGSECRAGDVHDRGSDRRLLRAGPGLGQALVDPRPVPARVLAGPGVHRAAGAAVRRRHWVIATLAVAGWTVAVLAASSLPAQTAEPLSRDQIWTACTERLVQRPSDAWLQGCVAAMAPDPTPSATPAPSTVPSRPPASTPPASTTPAGTSAPPPTTTS